MIRKFISFIKYLIYGFLSLVVSIRAASLCAFLIKSEFGTTPGLAAWAVAFIFFMALFWGLPGLGRRIAYFLDKRKGK